MAGQAQNFLRYYREANNFTMEEMGKRAGISKGAYFSIENGETERINPAHLVEWAAMLGVSVDELLTGKRAGSHTPSVTQNFGFGKTQPKF